MGSVQGEREGSAGASNYPLAADSLPPACVFICTFPRPCWKLLLQTAYSIEPQEQVINLMSLDIFCIPLLLWIIYQLSGVKGAFNRVLTLRGAHASRNPKGPATNATTTVIFQLLTPWRRVVLEKLTGSAASQEIPRIFWTWRFLTVFTTARHLSLSWVNSIQSPQPLPLPEDPS